MEKQRVFTGNRTTVFSNTCGMCKNGGIGCVAFQRLRTAALIHTPAPFRKKRACYKARPGEAREIIRAGTARACRAGEEAVAQVNRAAHVLL